MKDECSTHYRRCHVCDSLNESEDEVHKCNHCGKVMAPFFYFNESQIDECIEGADPNSTSGEYQPIYGLSALW